MKHGSLKTLHFLEPDHGRLAHIILEALGRLKQRLHEDPALVDAIAGESSLHPKALRTALPGWLDTLKAHELSGLMASANRPAAAIHVATLAPGNVPVIAAECLILGLLAGVKHTLALSTRAMSLALALGDELGKNLDDLNDWLELVVWRQCSGEHRRSILEKSQKMVVYGSDETIRWMASLLPSSTILVSHGPSLAVGYLDPSRLTSHGMSTALDGLVRDVALYDQRGCRSPHILFVRGSDDDLSLVRDQLIVQHIVRVHHELPVGDLTPAEATSVYLDRLTSRSLGEVVEIGGFCLTVERNPAYARPSPLGRTLRLVRLDQAPDLSTLIRTLTVPVRLVGISSDCPLPSGLLSPSIEVGVLGTLQSPPFNRLHDGRHRLDEYRM